MMVKEGAFPFGKKFNHLAGQTSAYLLQHAENPVDWYPWSDAALERARQEQKPIFLSIGYSACHWCHVMERESFEDPEIARILNEQFVCIKVDREERPDLDEIYMAAVQMITGSGGWPLNVFLTPDLEPFWGGTYFPPVARGSIPAFRNVLTAIGQIWLHSAEKIRQDGMEMRKALGAFWSPGETEGHLPDERIFNRAMEDFTRTFDPVWGGFGSAPKFPPWAGLRVLLRQYARRGQIEALQMADWTLTCMACGGLYDQIGGGFHRYSTDRQWRLPHFEKMLYDNAAAVPLYLEAWQITRKPEYRQVAVHTLDFLLCRMRDSSGGFHASLDADSNGQEGEHYLWTPEKIEAAVGSQDAAFLCSLYGVTSANEEESGASVLHLGHPSEKRWPLPGPDSERLDALRPKLLAWRERNNLPGKDTKIVASWNGMTLSALAHAAQVIEGGPYRTAAEETARFLLDRMRVKGKLLHCFSPQHPKTQETIPGFLDDYAEIVQGLLDLYEATFEPGWLSEADALMEILLSDFWDETEGGFFYTSSDHHNLLIRTKPTVDNGMSSGNASATWALLRLARFLDKPDYASRAERVLTLLSDRLTRHPLACGHLLLALDFYCGEPLDIVLSGALGSQTLERFRRVLSERFFPARVLLFRAREEMDGERAQAFVCGNRTCLAPVESPEELAALLDLKTVANREASC